MTDEAIRGGKQQYFNAPVYRPQTAYTKCRSQCVSIDLLYVNRYDLSAVTGARTSRANIFSCKKRHAERIFMMRSKMDIGIADLADHLRIIAEQRKRIAAAFHLAEQPQNAVLMQIAL